MSIIYKIFNDSGLTALINYIKATRAKAVSNEAAIDGLGEDLAGLSGEVVNALGNKQDKLTFDTTPTAGSTNPVTSGGVKSYVDDNIPDPGLQVATTAGTGAAYTATVSGIDSLTAGASFIMIPNVASTSVSPTMNVNGLGAKTIRRPISTNTTTTVAASDAGWLAAGKPIQVTYNGTYWVASLTRPYATDLYGAVPISNGGTGATTAAQARINLGIETRDGTVTSGNADYAEIGEWADGNTNDEDRIGYFVAIDTSSSGTTMVKATSTADVRGVTVSSPAFSGNCAEAKYDADTGELLKQYDYVAVMGLVSVIDNGTCAVNGRCMPDDNGTAVPSTNNLGYQVVDRTDDTHILIAVEPGADMIKRIKDDISGFGSKSTSVILTTSGWTLSGDRYYQTVAVADVTADTPVVIVDCALNGTDLDADVAVLEAWQGPSANNVAQGAGTLTFYSYDLPTVNIPVNVGVC